MGCGLGPGEPSPPRARGGEMAWGASRNGGRGRWPPRVAVPNEEPREQEDAGGRPLGLPSWYAGLPLAWVGGPKAGFCLGARS